MFLFIRSKWNVLLNRFIFNDLLIVWYTKILAQRFVVGTITTVLVEIIVKYKYSYYIDATHYGCGSCYMLRYAANIKI